MRGVTTGMMVAAVAFVAFASVSQAQVPPAKGQPVPFVPSNLPAQIQGAKTPAEHEAIANEYDRLAIEADHLAENHKGMEEAYTSGPAASKYATMTTHCNEIIASYKKAAQQYRALAAEHRALAKAK